MLMFLLSVLLSQLQQFHFFLLLRLFLQIFSNFLTIFKLSSFFYLTFLHLQNISFTLFCLYLDLRAHVDLLISRLLFGSFIFFLLLLLFINIQMGKKLLAFKIFCRILRLFARSYLLFQLKSHLLSLL